MRTIVDLPEKQVNELDRLRRRRGVSRAALVREAVDRYLDENSEEKAGEAFGIWRSRPVDALAHEHGLRDEWDR